MTGATGADVAVRPHPPRISIIPGGQSFNPPHAVPVKERVGSWLVFRDVYWLLGSRDLHIGQLPPTTSGVRNSACKRFCCAQVVVSLLASVSNGIGVPAGSVPV